MTAEVIEYDRSEFQGIATGGSDDFQDEYWRVSRRGRFAKVGAATVCVLVLLIIIGKASNIGGGDSSESSSRSSPSGPSYSKTGYKEWNLIQSERIDEIRADMQLYEHSKTKTQLVSVIPDDSVQDGVFGIAFRTLPENSHGAPHVLEHAVLSGSKHYPVKSPVNQLLGSSLATFINAMTSNDSTMYLVSSRNTEDLHNLVSVYLDAVFDPLVVTPEGKWIFRQEGWRIEDDPEAGMHLNGIVLSEMKGAYASPSTLLLKNSQKLLFPDTPARFDSGGDPSEIFRLTHEGLVHFYKKYYHPSNAQAFVYGGEERARDVMNQLDGKLRNYEANLEIRKQSEVPWQPLGSIPPDISVRLPYPSESDGNDHEFEMKWVINDVPMEREEELAWSVIDKLLMGGPTAPLQKQLLSLGLGGTVVGGLQSSGQQYTFSVGMFGLPDADAVKQVEQRILNTLDLYVERPDLFTDDEIEGALNSVEFELRDLSSGYAARGLFVFFRLMQKWLYGRDPFEALHFESALQKLRSSLEENGALVFAGLMSELLHDDHRVSLELYPNATMLEELNTLDATEIATLKSELSEDEFQEVLDESKYMETKHDEDDSEEALATIPKLSVDQLSRTGQELPVVVTSPGLTLLTSEVEFSFNILYARFGLDISGLPFDYLPLLPVFQRLLLEAGTTEYSDVQLTARIGRLTGGVETSIFVEEILPPSDDGSVTVSDGTHLQSKLFIYGSATKEYAYDLLSLFQKILLDCKLDNQEKVISVLKEEIKKMETSIESNGVRFAATRIAARYNPVAFIKEQYSGVTYIEKLEDYLALAESNWEELYSQLLSIKQVIINGHHNGMILSLTGDKEVLEKVQPSVSTFLLDKLPTNEDSQPFPDYAVTPHPWVAKARERQQEESPVRNEAIVVPNRINFIGKGGVMYEPGAVVSGSSQVVRRYIQDGLLFREIRIKNGAYGAFLTLDSHSGIIEFLSFRDPNFQSTIQVFDRTPFEIRDVVKKDGGLPAKAQDSIVAAIGEIDGTEPQPNTIGDTVTRRFLVRETPAMRQRWREEVLDVTGQDFLDFADLVHNWNQHELHSSVAAVVSLKVFGEAVKDGMKWLYKIELDFDEE